VPTYIVLFRGINVGGKNILAMKDLVAALESGQFRRVRSYIQSGNIVLDSAKNPENEIRAIVKKAFGIEPEVLCYSKTDFNNIVANNPYDSPEGKAVHFYFCKKAPKPNLEKIEQLLDDSEAYLIQGTVVYFHAPNGIGRSKLAAKMESCLGVPASARNLNTVVKLQTMAANVQ